MLLTNNLPFAFINNVVNLLHRLFIDNSHELILYSQIALFATLTASLCTLLVMAYVGPKRRLDYAYFIRELGIIGVLGLMFIRQILGFISPPLVLLAYTVMFFSALGIVVELLMDCLQQNADALHSAEAIQMEE